MTKINLEGEKLTKKQWSLKRPGLGQRGSYFLACPRAKLWQKQWGTKQGEKEEASKGRAPSKQKGPKVKQLLGLVPAPNCLVSLEFIANMWKHVEFTKFVSMSQASSWPTSRPPSDSNSAISLPAFTLKNSDKLQSCKFTIHGWVFKQRKLIFKSVSSGQHSNFCFQLYWTVVMTFRDFTVY